MKKIVLILALTIFFANNTKAADRNCIKYTADQAQTAIGDKENVSFGAVYSHAAERTGNGNADCLASDSPYVADNLPVVGKYGNRLLMLNRDDIISNYGLDPAEGCQVAWYHVNTDGGDDIQVGDSLYLSNPNGDPLATGSYYAVITSGDNQYRTQLWDVQ